VFLSSGLHKNASNTQVVSHQELGGILSDFKHSVIGSVKQSMMDAMKHMRKERTQPDRRAKPTTFSMVEDSDSECEMLDQDSSESEVESW